MGHHQARRFIKDKINEFFNKELQFRVINTEGWRVAYTNVEDEDYVKAHIKSLQTPAHLEAFQELAKYFAPRFNDEVAWHLSLHFDKAMLVIKYQEDVEVIFLTRQEAKNIATFASEENRFIDRRMGSVRDADSPEAVDLYKAAVRKAIEIKKRNQNKIFCDHRNCDCNEKLADITYKNGAQERLAAQAILRKMPKSNLVKNKHLKNLLHFKRQT